MKQPLIELIERFSGHKQSRNTDPVYQSASPLRFAERLSNLTLFNESCYLRQNPDVAAAVARGQFKSRFEHYLDFGRFEGRSVIG